MDSFVEVNNIKSEHITNKGIYIDKNKKYLVLRNVDIKFAGDNSKFERNSSKVKKYLKFTISDEEIKEKLIKLSEEINADNSFYNSETDLFTVFINNDTNMYDINKNIVKNDMKELYHSNIDMIVNIYTIKNTFGCYERMTAKQIKINKIEKNVFSNCCL